MKRYVDAAQIVGQHFFRETALLLIQIHGDNVEMNWRTLTQQQQNVEQAIAVFATRHAHHHFVAVFNHVEIGNGLAHLLGQAFLKFVELKRVFLLGLVGENRDGLHD